MRTKGPLNYDSEADPKYVRPGTIEDENGFRIFEAWGNDLAETDCNAVHLIACWNAIEAIGGNPKVVSDMVTALKRAVVNLDNFAGPTGELNFTPEGLQTTSRDIKAVLDKTKVTP